MTNLTEEQYNKSISLKRQIHEIDELIKLMEGKVKRTTYYIDSEEVILHYNRLASIYISAVDDNHSYRNVYTDEIPSYLFPRILNTLKECKNEFEKEFSEL